MRFIAEAALQESERLHDMNSLMLSRTSLAMLAQGYLNLEEQLEALQANEKDWSDQARRHCEQINALQQAMVTVLLDPLTSHGARAYIKQQLGIEHVPFEAEEDFVARVLTQYPVTPVSEVGDRDS